MVVKEIEVVQMVTVAVDESKFTPEFMETYRRSFNDFHTLDDHLAHLGRLFAQGLADDGSFIEGYGLAAGMGIKFTLGDVHEELIDENY